MTVEAAKYLMKQAILKNIISPEEIILGTGISTALNHKDPEFSLASGIGGAVGGSAGARLGGMLGVRSSLPIHWKRDPYAQVLRVLYRFILGAGTGAITGGYVGSQAGKAVKDLAVNAWEGRGKAEEATPEEEVQE